MNLKKLSIEEQENLIPDNLIFLGYRGSIAHGLYIPNTDPNSIDDKDIMGCFLAKRDYYIGLKKEKETIEKWYNEWDCVYYEIRKLFHLLLKGNPNVLSLLWLDDRYILKTTPAWDMVKENKDIFVSKKVYHSFTGYAYGQFKRMTHNVKQGYMGEKRKALVDKFGYDCKNAAHLIRLLNMGIEFLVEGKLYVERKFDAAQLISIKTGEWSLKKIKEEAENLFKHCELAYINSKLPNEPDYEKANKICITIIKEIL
jgi:predicted nucleotidyltransferase